MVLVQNMSQNHIFTQEQATEVHFKRYFDELKMAQDKELKQAFRVFFQIDESHHIIKPNKLRIL